MSALKYWLWLSSLRLSGAAQTFALIERFGTPENVFFADGAEFNAEEGMNADQREELLRHNMEPAERILEQCDRAGLRLVTLQDATYPERLKNIYAPPCLLYVKGRLPAMDEEAALTVVGTRRMTPYGEQITGRLVYGLARAGMLIVSGMARGVDAAAHAAALQAGGTTVAVLGCGADMAYPAENRQLYEDIAATGAVISEYPPGTRPLGAHFPARNRILSGLSLGVFVTEAPVASGALITARLALEQGRDVFAAPGNIDAHESAGCNQLLKEGAGLVTAPADILTEYAALYPHKITLRPTPVPPLAGYEGAPADIEREGTSLVAEAGEKPRSGAKRRRKDMPVPRAVDLTDLIKDFTEQAQSIIISVAGTSRHVDEIVEATGLPASRVLRELTMLELKGAVRSLPGKRYELALPDGGGD